MGVAKMCVGGVEQACTVQDINAVGACAISNCSGVLGGDLAVCLLDACEEAYANISVTCQGCALETLRDSDAGMNTILMACGRDGVTGWVEPVYTELPDFSPAHQEQGLCDGLDNNCDGQVDEGCACTPGMSEACGRAVG